MEKLKIAVIFGGVSTEHEVSRWSATTVLNHLDPEKYQVEMVGITKEGRWLRYTGEVGALQNGQWEQGPVQDCTLNTSRNRKGLLVLEQGTYQFLPLDCVIPVLHGKNGEDGTIQGLFQIAGLPFVGCDAISSANCMDKEMTHVILESAGIPMAKWQCVRQEEDQAAAISRIEEKLDYPVFVKPANAGSSVGVSKACDREQLKTALQTAFHEDKKAIVEETIVGKEVECAVLGNQDAKPAIAGEILSANEEIYDYEAKYVNPQSQVQIPADIQPDTMELLRQTAVKAYHAIGCEGLSRVDFFVTPEQKVILNEINTLPGFTDISMYPKMWVHMGVSISELLDRLIQYALSR